SDGVNIPPMIELLLEEFDPARRFLLFWQVCVGTRFENHVCLPSDGRAQMLEIWREAPRGSATGICCRHPSRSFAPDRGHGGADLGASRNALMGHAAAPGEQVKPGQRMRPEPG